MRLPRETSRRTCVICERIFPETFVPVPAPPTVLPPPATLLSPIQQPLVPRTQPFTTEENDYNRYSITRSYIALAGELNRLTGALGNLDPDSERYNETLGHVKRVTKIMCTMSKLVDDCK